MPAQRKAYPRSIVVVEGRELQGLHDRAAQLLRRGNLHAFPSRFWLVIAILVAAPTLALAQQTSNVAPRITAAVDPSSRVTIPQSKHPLAQPAFDAGALDGTTPMQRMILVLGVSPEQDHELTTFLDSQHTQGSPDYHNWLTPDQFGQRFGPAPQDIQVVVGWLQQQGFTVGSVARSGRWIEFSGTSAQVEAAFQTQMRHYLVNGEAHVANASNLSIPSALAPVVRGVASLHNFFSKPMHVQGAFVRRTTNGMYAPLGGEVDLTTGHAVSPADFATIYDVPNSLLSPAPSTVLNGTGETIAIVARTDINPQDVADFRTVTGLPAVTASNPNFILNGEDPGIWSPGDQVETTLDTEWSGAVAPAATIDVVISEPTLIEDGVDLSSVYIVDHNLAPVMSVSFGGCEALNGSGAGSESAFVNSLWQQAAAQGISVFVASGDDGAAGCDPNEPVPPPGAAGSVGINALSSPWYDTAVGGTEFNESITTTNFWNPVNATNLQSVLGYIPEMAWNDSCSTGCDEGFDSLEAGGGGVSLLYATPPYQTLNVSGLQAALSPFAVSGVTPRGVPDVSLAASPNHDGYLLCLNLSCEPTTNPGFYMVGGTSVSSPTFAGIMALVDQKLGNKAQGLANYVLYPLAAAETYSACNSSSRTNPATPTTCVFNDNTVGNNGVPGNDVTNDPTTGALGYPTGTGFDLASGLGSVDAKNLINAWSTSAAAFFGTQTTITSPASISITHGATVAITGSTARLSTDGTTLTPTGTLALIAQGGPFPSPVGLGSTTMSGSGATATGTADIGDLPGGSYTLYANYPGDGTFAGSASAAINVTVAKEAPAVELLDVAAGASTINNTPILVSYGTPIAFEALVSGLSSINNSTGDGAATGTVTFTRTLGSTTTNLSPAITLINFAQADTGLAEFFDCSGTPSTCLTFGVNTINGSYSGDNSYTAGNSGTSSPSFSLLVTVTSAMTSTSVSSSASGTTVLTATPVTLNAAVATSSGSGNAPNGTVTFFSGSTQLGSPVAVTGTAGNQTFAGAGTTASAVASLTTTLPAGTDNITAIYNGDTADSDYAASSASAPIIITVTAMAGTTTTVSASPNPSTLGQNVALTATVTSTQTSPAITGTVTFSEGSTTIGSAPVSSGQATLMTTALPLGTFTIKATYSGDTNYTGSSGTTTTTFTVNNPAPTLTSISPTSGIVGHAVSSLVLTGSGFVASSTVNFGSNPITGGTVGSGGTTLTVTVPAGDVATAGPLSVTVTNGTPGGGTSGPKTFTVDNPVPTITVLSPASATAGGGAFSLTVTGTNFGAGATVNFGTFTGLVPTSITATTIVVTVPATDIATGATINVSVSNAAPGGGTSGTLPFTINNPLPTVTSLSPTSATAGGGAFTLTITGTNFVAGATVTFGSFGPLTPTSVTATQIAVTIPAADTATAGSINVSVSNPAPGGGTSANSAFAIKNPTPTLTGIAPTSGIVGQAVSSLVLTGSGFVASSTVNFGSNQITGGTVGGGGTTLTVTVPAGDVATAGPVSVTVTNGTPGGGTSGPQTFTVDNPVPTITLLSPASATAGGAAFSLTITGTNFGAGATVNFGTFTGLVPTSITATTIVATVPATDIASGATINVSVSNAAPGGGTSGTLPFTINNPLPTVTSLSPTSATAGGAAFQLTITGTGFVGGVSSVTFGSNAAIIPPAASITPTQMQVQIPASYIALAGNINVTVSNPAPGGGTSATSANSAFAVKNPTPTLTGIAPTSGIVGQAVSSLVLTGSGFVASSTVNFGSNQITGGTVGSGGTTLTVTVPAGDVATAGPLSVTVTNGTPGGGTSGPQTFTVDNPVPTITLLSPASATAGGAAFLLTITGTNFEAGATVNFGTFSGLVPTSITATTIVVTVPATDIASGATINVSVSDAAPGGGTSGTLPFTINNPLPTVTSLSPTSATAGGAAFALTITGTNFGTGATVNFGAFTGLVPTSITTTTIVVTVPATDIATSATINVSVSNPAPGGGTSAASANSAFAIKNPAPTLTSIAPTSGPLGQAVSSLVLSGSGFVASSTVNFGSNQITGGTVGGGGATLTVSVPAGDVATAGPLSVTVTNGAPGGGTSGPQTFTVDNPVPTITQLSPASATAGGAVFALTITGTGFAAGATVTFGTFGAIVPTSISPTQIVVQIPAIDIATGGNINVAVTNVAPGGGTSTTKVFPVNNAVPTISGLSPTGVTVNSGAFNLTINGTGFAAGATVSFGTFTGLAPTSIAAGQIVVQIPAGDIGTVSSVNVVVTNPTPGGGPSTGFSFSIASTPNPAPTLTSISPTSGTAGQSVNLTLTGTNFIAGSIVTFGGIQDSGATLGTGGNTLTITIPASQLSTAGPVSVTVTNPAPGGGTSLAQTFTINNPLPVVTAVSPTSGIVGQAVSSLVLTGSGFVASSTVNFGSNPITGGTVGGGGTTLTVTVPAGDVATAGPLSVTVTNGTPGGGTSGPQTFTVDNPVPTITLLSPASATAGGAAFSLTITGANFGAGATVNFGTFTGLVPTSITATTIVATVPATDIASGATINVSVSNAAPGGGTSGTLPFTINNPLPTVTSLSPTSATAGGAAFQLTITGTGFVGGVSSVTFGSNAAITPPTASVTPTQMQVQIPATYIALAGNINVTVSNPAPGGGTSANSAFAIKNPTPTLTSISPTSGPLGQAVSSLVLTGSGFVASSTVNFGSNQITGGTVGSGGTTLTVTVPAGDVATAGAVSVTVTNATPGGGTSGPETFTVDNPVPTITQLSPASANAGGAAFGLTITGTGFAAGATVTFGTFRSIVPTTISPTQIVVQIPATDIATRATINISVSNPAPDGGTSGTLPFTINNPLPTVTSLSPASATADGAAFQLTITGTGFVSGVSSVTFGSNAAITPPTASVTPTQIQVQIPATYIALAGNINVTVSNPAPGGGTSATSANSAFAIKNPTPTLTSISPTSGPLGQAVSSLVLTGSGFVAGSTVNFGSNPITGGTVGSGGTTLTVTVPAGDVATAGAVSVTVTNATPGGGTSGPETFTVDNPVPTITQFSPASASAGGGAFTLTITGTNFGTGATVTFGSFGPLTPTSVTATQIAVTISGAEIATAASINVSVTNPAPGGGTSNAEPFTIEDPVPSLASLSPTSTTAGGVPFALTINGSGFRAGATVNFGSNDGLVPTSITAGQIVLQIPAAATAASATVNVTVTNPSPTIGPSNPEIFTVNNPVPTITSVSPTHAPGGAGFTMTITGSGFVTGATVTLGTGQALTPTTISPTQVVVAVPASDMAAGGTPKVAVTNPTPGGGASTEQVTFTVDDFTMTISASPASVTAGQSLAINVTLGPTDSNGFGNAVNFSVSGLPGTSTISPNPIPAVMVGNSFATFVLTLNTTMRSAVPATPRRPVQPLGIQIILWSMTVALALMALATLERGHRTRRWRAALPSAVLLAVLAVASGCTTANTNSATAGTPAGPYQISVTATSGTLVHTSPAVTITVN